MSAIPDPETAPPVEPVGAVDALFGERADTARRFCAHLATSAVARGLIGPREIPRLWERHLLNCAAIAERVPGNATLVDVGSGAGLPGLAVAIARSDVRVTLVEPLQRRVAWLEEVIDDLSLTRVEVLRARAEDLVGKVHADVVTARAVAALPVLTRLCLPLVRPGGHFLAVKGRSAAEELASAVPELRLLGAVAWEVLTCGDGVLSEPTTVVEITAGEMPRLTGKRGRRTKATTPKSRGGSRRPR
ncbi:MAG: rRNA (guanine527-N7)-methyltransferase [Actinomycetota bacterium]|nr:rRNA (guanine527-N7)-methyltransferase [Actinomycetota bacterium]